MPTIACSTPLRELDLRIEGTWIEGCVDRLYDELRRRGIRFRPHVWLSTEWFSPDGIPGIAIPFYLAHPRLMRLEARQMLEVEGGGEAACMRLLRHEAGHAIDSAYRLHSKRRWQVAFGRHSEPYPDVYRPKPGSRNHVLHLGAWYAQAHPSEDYAETFAVWLTPRSGWRSRYREWPRALHKLETVDQLLTEVVAGKPPRVRSRARIDPLERLRETLGEHYHGKRARYGASWPDVYDRDLARIFSDGRRPAGRPSAASLLKKYRVEIRRSVAEWTGAPVYTVDQVLQDVIERCRERRLRLAVSERQARIGALLLLTVHTMSCLYAGRQEIPL